MNQGTTSAALTEEERRARRERQINFWGALGLSIFAAVYLIAAFFIQNISTAQWYDAPSLFPRVIGTLLLVFCLIYLWQNRDGHTVTKEDRDAIIGYLKSSQFVRLCVSIGTLALYVFVLLGLQIGPFKLPYEAATFLYLFVTMLYFRPKEFKVWKIVLICAVLSFVIGFGFSNFAKIPLP